MPLIFNLIALFLKKLKSKKKVEIELAHKR